MWSNLGHSHIGMYCLVIPENVVICIVMHFYMLTE